MQPVRIAFIEGRNISPEYPTCCPFSKDNGWLLLAQGDGFTRLHTGGGAFVRALPSSIHTRSSPRWGTHPDEFSYLSGNQIYSFNVVSGTSLLMREFPKYIEYTLDEQNGVSDSGEADTVGNHRVFAGIKKSGGATEVFGLDLTTGLTGTPLPVGTYDGLKLSHDLRIILSQRDGIFVTDDMAWRRIYPHNSHACPCVYRGVPSLAVIGDKNVILVNLATAAQTIVPFLVDSSLVVAHVSACDKPFLILSTSAPANNAPSQIVRISLEDLSAEVLCDTGTAYRGYESQPKASLSRDGSRVVFAVDDGKQVSAWMIRLDAETQPVPIAPTPVLTTFDASKFGVKVERGTITVYPVAA